MKRSIRILVVVALFAHIAFVATAQDRPSKQYEIRELFDTTAVTGASFSSDGSRILVSTNESGIYNAYAIPVDGSPRERLTDSEDDAILARSYFPADDRFIYTADQGGNELNHVYVREIDGSITDITPGEKLKASFLAWSHDRASFFLLSNERDPRYFDLYEVQAEGYEKALLFENNTGFNVVSVSPDKQLVALQKPETRAKADVYVHDRRTGETRRVTEHEGDVLCSPQQFARDGKSLHCLTDAGHEFRYLVREDLATGKMEVLEKANWDVSFTRISRAGKFLVVGLNNDARTEIRLYDADTGERVTVPALEGVAVSTLVFNADDTAIAYYTHGGATPGDLHYLRLEGTATPRKLTNRLNDAIDPADLVEPEVVRFTSFDGVEVPGILYKPHQAGPDNKLPALVYVHGGPGGQTRATYNPVIQYLVNRGYVVYGINNRGSSGYGKTFFALDDLKHGQDDLDDCVASKKMLIETGYVDPERIGIMGGSYGGYMVCAALAFRPEEFEVGVNIFGVTNWVRTLKSIPAWWESARNSLYKELGDPFTQEDYLRKISPLFHASNIVKPMIVLQGKNDPRVLQVESDEMVEAARANGVPVEYVIFDDEGHGFRKRENQIQGYEAVRKFLDTHL